MINEAISQSITELRLRIETVFSQHQDNFRASLLGQLLLSQVNTLEIHLHLIALEGPNPFLFSDEEFNELMEPYLKLNKEIRTTIIRAPNSLYETEPINGLYEFLSWHYRESGEE